MNVWDVLILLGIALLLFLGLRAIRRNKTGSCRGCPYCGACEDPASCPTQKKRPPASEDASGRN